MITNWSSEAGRSSNHDCDNKWARIDAQAFGQGDSHRRDDNGNCEFVWDTLPFTLPAGIVGAALLTLGATILANSAGKTKKRKQAEAGAKIKVQPTVSGFQLQF